ncbi:MAG: class I SAM-dependent methyltransferase [Rhodocyclales bacterium]|nr:class I SAM-dependent methyltransferase [Rhodocyclales bacterium]
MSDAPSAWIRRFLPLVAAGGAALDLACGRGRHTVLLAEHGLRVTAVDRDGDALAAVAARVPGAELLEADIEGGPWPFAGRRFDVIVVANYLHRPLLPLLVDSLSPGGALIYETFMVGNARFGKPSSPEFLLRRDELLDVVRGKLGVVAFEQGEIETPRPAVVQRLCAVRGEPALLPA